MESEFFEFVASILKVPAAELGGDVALGSIPEWDSVAHLRLVLEIEAKYKVKFDLEEIPRLNTLGQFLSALRRKVFLRAMAESLEVDNAGFDTVFSEVPGWCSLMAFSMLVAIERKFGVALQIARLCECRTLGEVAALAGITSSMR